jgi:hypothetical protein
MNSNLASLQRSISTFVNALLLQRNTYGEITIFVSLESALNRLSPYVITPNANPDIVSQNLARALEAISSAEPGAGVFNDPLQSFTNALRGSLGSLRGRASTHFIYLRDQDIAADIEARYIPALQSQYRSRLNLRPSSEFRSQLQFVSYLSGSSRCPFASHQSATYLNRLFTGLDHLWTDLCNYQFEAGAAGWNAASRTLAENIHQFQSRLILTCIPIAGITVTARGAALSVGRDFQYLRATNEITFLNAGSVQLQLSDRIEVTYDCAI